MELKITLSFHYQEAVCLFVYSDLEYYTIHVQGQEI